MILQQAITTEQTFGEKLEEILQEDNRLRRYRIYSFKDEIGTTVILKYVEDKLT